MKSFDTSAIEHQLEENFSKKTRKKMLSAAGPFLLVVTFIEDGMRIFLRWGEQVHYMTAVMRLNYWVGVQFLLISAATQLGSSFLVLRPEAIKPSRVKPACYALLTFVSSQPFMYGQATDVDFMCRSITLAGGLLLLIWSENDRQRRSEMGTGLLQGVQGAGADRLQLCGRLALTFLFLFQVSCFGCYHPPAHARALASLPSIHHAHAHPASAHEHTQTHANTNSPPCPLRPPQTSPSPPNG